jgi:predicted hydrocarbon binding protein
MVSKRYPKDLLCSVYSPDRRLVEFVVKLKNVPGTIAKISNRLAEKGINILSGFHTAYPSEEAGTWGFFVDLTKADVGPEEIAKQIGELDVTLDVKLSEAKFDGLIIDDLHFPIVILGERSTVLKVETFGDMFGRLYETFGSGAAVILYEMGVSAGENKAKNVSEKYGVNGLKALRIILAERVAKGWGIPNIAEFNEERLEATISVQDLFECLPFKGKYKEGRSHFFRGYLTGVFHQLFRKDASTTEVECVAKGDANCKFTIK